MSRDLNEVCVGDEGRVGNKVIRTGSRMKRVQGQEVDRSRSHGTS